MDDAMHGSLLWTSDHDDGDDGTIDACFLDDALAFLDVPECDSEPPVAKRPRQSTLANAKTTTVTRRREEIAQLRNQVESLEEARNALRKRQRGDAASESGWLIDCTTMWEALATRQREQREQVTRENERLKRALQELRRQRDDLALVLRRKRASAGESGGPERLSSSPPRGPPSSATLFAELMESLRPQYLDTHRVLATSRATPSYHPLQSSYHATITPRNTLVLVEHVIYPFSYQDTVPVVWEALSGVTDAKPGVNYNTVDLREDSFRLEIAIDLQLERKRGAFQLQTVAKRIVEAHRTVIVWTGLAVPSGVGNTSTDGISIRQHGWLVIEPVAATELAAGSAGVATRSTMYFEDCLLLNDGVKKKATKAAILLQYLMGIYAQEGGTRRQQTENKLMEKALRIGTVR